MIEFIHKETGEQLCAISRQDLRKGEVEATKEKLAFEKGLRVEQIETAMKFMMEKP